MGIGSCGCFVAIAKKLWECCSQTLLFIVEEDQDHIPQTQQNAMLLIMIMSDIKQMLSKICLTLAVTSLSQMEILQLPYFPLKDCVWQYAEWETVTVRAHVEHTE